MIGAGKFNQYVSLQAPTETQSATGEPTKTWATYAYAWASIETLSIRERYMEKQIATDATHRVTFRYNAGVLSSHRILWGARILDIGTVQDPGQRHEEMILECRERIV